MFNFFKKKECPKGLTKKSIVELKHSNGEVIKITIEGSNSEQVVHISNRIKYIFNNPTPSANEYDQKYWEEFRRYFKELDNVFDKASKEINKAFDDIEKPFKK